MNEPLWFWNGSLICPGAVWSVQPVQYWQSAKCGAMLQRVFCPIVKGKLHSKCGAMLQRVFRPIVKGKLHSKCGAMLQRVFRPS